MPTDDEIRAQQNFWSQLENGTLKTLPALAKLDADPEIINDDYSVALDFWGVDLQRANHLKDAQKIFAEASAINPDNYIAKLNLQYNASLQKGDARPVESSELFDKALFKYRGLVGVLKLNGPPDEPDAILQTGELMAQSGNLRQAATLFSRRLELLPNDSQAELDMAKTYADRGKLDKVNSLVVKLRSNPKVNQWDLTRIQAMAYLTVGSNFTAESLLKSAVKADPNDERRVGTLADLYGRFGYEELHQNRQAYARAYFSAALTNVEHQIKLIAAASRSGELDISFVPTLLKKAEMQVMLGRLSQAISTLGDVLKIQPDNTTALLNRAVAESQLKRIEAAKTDYKTLARLMPQQGYLVDYHLADVAALETNAPEEIRCLKRYLNAAPDGTAEYASAQKRLQTLEGQ